MSSSFHSRYEGQLDNGMEGYQQENTIDDFYKGRGFRLSHYAITAILARVYQYMGNDDKAFEYADKVLTFQATTLDGNKRDMFEEENWWDLQSSDKLEDRKHLKMPSNLIFALYNEDAYEDYGLDSYFKKKVTDNNPGQWFVIDLRGQGFFKNPETKEDERDDPRFKFLLFTPEYSSFSNGNYFISAKGFGSESATIRKDNVKILPVIRTTEMRYIKAEVFAKRGQYDEAYKLLNKIRENRGIWTPLTQQNTMEKFLRDMVNDAQREYLSEGQLFYLYKRLNYDVQIGDKKRKMEKAEYMYPLPDNQNM